jgi:hypothetical protein
MNKASGPVDRIKIGLRLTLLAALTGCVDFGSWKEVAAARGGAEA